MDHFYLCYFQRYPHTVPPTQFPSVQHGEKHRNFLRKSPASFSWDWGPAFIPSGMPGHVTLVRGQDIWLESLAVSTRLGEERRGKEGDGQERTEREELWEMKVIIQCHTLRDLKMDPKVKHKLIELGSGVTPTSQITGVQYTRPKPCLLYTSPSPRD